MSKKDQTTTMVNHALEIIRNPDFWPRHIQWAKQLLSDWVACGFPEEFDQGDLDMFKSSFNDAFNRR